jgi:hypothetical protein
MIIEVNVPGQENEQSWTCLSVFILLLSTIFQSDLLNCSRTYYPDSELSTSGK